MRTAAAWSFPCGGCFVVGRRTGCGTQHPLRLACVSLAAAPTTPRCFRRWRRSSSLQSAPLLFESTRLCESDICAKENRQCISTPAVFSWARVDYASRAAKNSLAGCFCPAGREAPGRSCSHPPAYVSLTFAQKKTASVSLHQRFFHGRGWIRTTEAEKQQIYSLSPLATREHAHILFVSVAGRLA